MRKHPRGPRAAFTLIETILALSLVAGTFWIAFQSIDTGRRAFRTSAAVMDLESDGNRTLRRIVDALRAAEEASISAIPQAPFSSSSVDFQILERYDGSKTPLSAPRNISIDATTASVMWVENPGLASERRTRWSNDVSALLEGEIANGVDDNGNGLIDEAGLCFSREGRLIRVGLTITTNGPDGPLTRTWTASLQCRN